MIKNAKAYCISQEKMAELSQSFLEESLKKKVHRPCGPMDPMTTGWVSEGGEFVKKIGRYLVLCHGTTKRALPGGAVKKQLAKRIDAHVAQYGQKPGRKTLAEMKELVIAEMLPHAPEVDSFTPAWLDLDRNRFVVGTATNSKADQIIADLRVALGEQPLGAIKTEMSPSWYMHARLSGANSEHFVANGDATLEVPDEKGRLVRYANSAMEDEAIAKLLSNGLLPVSLSLTFDDACAFVLNHDFSIKSLSQLQITEDADDEMEPSAAKFLIAAESIGTIMDCLIEEMGGASS